MRYSTHQSPVAGQIVAIAEPEINALTVIIRPTEIIPVKEHNIHAKARNVVNLLIVPCPHSGI
jgi:hypothetical protein